MSFFSPPFSFKLHFSASVGSGKECERTGPIPHVYVMLMSSSQRIQHDGNLTLRKTALCKRGARRDWSLQAPDGTKRDQISEQHERRRRQLLLVEVIRSDRGVPAVRCSDVLALNDKRCIAQDTDFWLAVCHFSHLLSPLKCTSQLA